MTDEKSPKVASQEWGQITLVGGARFKDAKLFPGGAREWDWGETGTRHEPGIQVTDTLELLEAGAETVVLSRGVHERLQVPDATIAFLEAQGVDVIALQTEAAVARYNELVEQGIRVGALLHSTC